ncbi:plant UBX domain-containing protein 1-like isoform X2 [Nicotiana sylvestris]|nr:PREDICTED: tether containing UBX domain for GLUT4-like isoform X2 [Nicotiana sylvestris]
MRFTTFDPMDLDSAKLAAAKEKFGREIYVFETSTAASTPSNVYSNKYILFDQYDFLNKNKYLKTRNSREAEEAARKARIIKAVIRVRFPYNYTLEAIFHPSETIQSLHYLLAKVVAHQELPFYL